ncbi:phosphoglycerate dehydrogenase-like enzyme [Microbacterium trichothecenolyticum]|uniref:D-2-hydroxyacid dehydrogenase n=1 Tax=Microbacterium trichothecenolyticum TaxID=69370 RepID=UPI002857C7A7|nr:D-2-hydroxyacid dehydrogenase [Microbacterium trichothecenolyticum]MDR7113704.1 phosphoglycerate dehydrogenase-like enzyme [Microbacterium trichothecenolyticum]
MNERPINSVLVTVPFPEDDIAELRRAFEPAEFILLRPNDGEGIAEALQRVDVAVHVWEVDDRFLAAPLLKWVHCDRAGLTQSARPEVFEKGLLVTGSAGRSAPALAQHAFFFALSIAFDARALAEQQASHTWGGIPGYHDRLALHGQTLGVVGLGNTGREIAALGRAFGMHVIGYTRSANVPDGVVDELLVAAVGDSIDGLVERSDVVMLAAPLTDETFHLFDAARFASMKPTATVINVGRGQLIDQDALIAALKQGRIGGAGLDVTHPEPLPADSELWDLPNVIITPHVTPKLADRTTRSVRMIVENVRRYRAGEELLNALRPADIFSH